MTEDLGGRGAGSRPEQGVLELGGVFMSLPCCFCFSMFFGTFFLKSFVDDRKRPIHGAHLKPCPPKPRGLKAARSTLGPALLSIPALRATYAKFTTALCRLCCLRRLEGRGHRGRVEMKMWWLGLDSLEGEQ